MSPVHLLVDILAMVLVVVPMLILVAFFVAASLDFLLGGGTAATKTLSNADSGLIARTTGIDFAGPPR